jgi:purine-binding chemotaxis protein CheW
MSTETALKAQSQMQVVTFHLGDEDFAVEITKVKEIILIEGITKVPQVPAYIEGVINLRGVIVPVIDLRKRLGMHTKAVDQESRIMITRLEDRSIGMIVDSVSKVMKIPRADIMPQPDSISSMAKDYLVGLAKVEKGILLIIDLEKVLSSPEKANLAKTRF